MKNKTLDEACLNPDGKTYNGYKLTQWLMEIATGKSLPMSEARKIVAEGIRLAEERKKNR